MLLQGLLGISDCYRLLSIAIDYFPLGADHLTLEGGGGVGDFEKKFPASACRKKKIACSTNVIEKNSCTAVKKYPTHQVARKKKSCRP